MKRITKLSMYILMVNILTACSTIVVDITSPADGANVGSGTFAMQTEIRSSGRCMGGERCAHTNWVLKVNGTDVCSGTGTGGTGTYSWCANVMGSYCIFDWNNINTADLGSGSHELKVVASASCHKDGIDSITVTVP